MSLSAVIWDVTRCDGVLKLWLSDRGQDSAGQASLLVGGECVLAERLVGYSIWAGGSGPIMCGDTKIGRRVGYGGCVLWDCAIREVLDGDFGIKDD
jgi:hypothetical protein